MMYYTCANCGKPIRKPYPSKKYCGENCRESNRKSRVAEQELLFWNSVKPLPLTTEDEEALRGMAEGPRAAFLIERFAPPDAIGYRVGCRRVGAESWNHTVHWFPLRRERTPALFQLRPTDTPLDIPCPTEYVVAYFDQLERVFDAPRFKLFLKARAVRLNWSDGDRSLLLEGGHR